MHILRFVVLRLLTFSIVASAACEGRDVRISPLSERNEKIRKITYHKDTRPSPALCYAYMWDGAGSGGCGLSTVSCDAVANLVTSFTQEQKVRYYRDDRPETPLCYAYMWCGAGNGGPGLSTVPCDDVRHLLPMTPIDYD